MVVPREEQSSRLGKQNIVSGFFTKKNLFASTSHLYLAFSTSCHHTIWDYTLSYGSSLSHKTPAVATHNHNLYETFGEPEVSLTRGVSELKFAKAKIDEKRVGELCR